MNPQQTPHSTIEASQTENDKVVMWRFEQMKEAGIKPAYAVILADAHHSDLHKILAAKLQGCPDTLLLEIFK